MAKDKNQKQPVSNIAAPLREYVERIEKLREEKKEIGDAINDIYKEAKSNGLDAPTIREIVKLRALDENERSEREFKRDLYMRALNLMSDLV